jgi:pyridoxine/pyridoxamine 5'-phosphate oxidase
MPEFDPVVAPDDPVTLFLRWLEVAIQDEVPAPHAVTLSPRAPRPARLTSWPSRPLAAAIR